MKPDMKNFDSMKSNINMKQIIGIVLCSLFIMGCAQEPVERGITEMIGNKKYIMPKCSSNPTEVIKYYRDLKADVTNRQEGTSVLVDVRFESAEDVLLKTLHYEFFDMGNGGYELMFAYDPSVVMTVEMKRDFVQKINGKIN